MLNRYRGQRNHAETWRAIVVGGLMLTAWGATLSVLALAPGEGRISVVGTALADDVVAADGAADKVVAVEGPVRMATAETVETR